jgi:integrase
MEHGGFLVRARILDGRTREQVTIIRALSTETDARRALAWLVDEREKVRAGVRRREQSSMLQFCAFAAQLLEDKVRAGDLASQATRDLWKHVLTNHLYETPFAAFFVDQIRASDILAWKESIIIGKGRGKVSPHTANAWLRILAVIVRSYVRRYELEKNPMLSVPLFETKRWRGRITREQPNSLTPEELRLFLRLCRELEPEDFAMICLGFALGARPSSLRPLRRSGPEKDYNPETGELLLRRSHTRGAFVMESTKNAEDTAIILPATIRDILSWHEEAFLVGRKVQGGYRENKTASRRAASELLFPSRTGGLQSTTSLWKPFEVLTDAMKKEMGGKFTKVITPKAMRRTSKDLMRACGVPDLVAMQINSHLDPEMHAHYSTIGAAEMGQAVAKVIDLAGYREAMGP